MHLDAQPRRFHDQVVNDLVEELVLAEAAMEFGVHLRLDVKRLGDAIRVEEKQQDGLEHLTDRAQVPAARLVQRRVLEGIAGRVGSDDAMLAELLDEIGADAAGIEELLELDVGQLLDLGLGVIHAALLANARANLPHDLFDVD